MILFALKVNWAHHCYIWPQVKSTVFRYAPDESITEDKAPMHGLAKTAFE
jgi:hypothetical protein